MPPGTITTIIVSLNPESRAIWEATRDMSEDEYDRLDEPRVLESEQGKTVSVTTAKPDVLFDRWGYRVT